MKLTRRTAIEAIIGHLMTDTHMDRNFFKGNLAALAYAVQTETDHNLRLVLK